MTLSETFHQMIQDSMAAAQLTDLKIGTVVAVDPLEITINPAMDNLQAGVLHLTAGVIERKIPVLSHTHAYSEGVTGEALASVACLENGKPLPVENGYIILSRGLQAGDKVLLLRVQQGQRFIVLSRVMEVS